MMRGKSRRRAAAFAAAVLVAALCALGLVGCGGEAQKEGDAGQEAERQPAALQTVTDMVGREVEVPQEAQRIVGIGSSSLRLISYLQATDKVVGVEQSELEDNVTCAYRHVNHEAFSQLPVIGDGGSKGVTSNEEALMQAAPEVIFASIDRDAADTLQERTGIPVVCLTLSDLVFDQVFYDNVELVGGIVGKSARADEIVAYMQAAQQDLRERVADLPEDEVKSAYAAGISFRGGHGFAGTEASFPPFVETNVENVADAAGAAGAFDIDLEEVASAQPDHLFVEGGNLSLVKEDYDANPAYFEALDAVRAGNVHTLISYRFYATNIELALANCYQVGAVVYPERFADIDPLEKLDEITEFFLGAPLSDDLAAEGLDFRQVDLAAL